ncbi:hypothetical protein KDA_44800 [Dictyobacter alpinus]|uniref:DUF4352 domain-containing protein n=1 Tax=Dictyobacter alpinus TaxID=2014873 RepID=A0A402BCE3_9CHLR|nr:DUF4352 domain-containing protein [Dictyobacter alpinus]GCE28996.1 hypothetical protein KDA_44800 [Dictyobacter alpinus]
MSIFDALLILTVLGSIVAIFTSGYFLLRRRWQRARRILLVLAISLVLYTLVLLSVALLSPQRILAMHQNRCFDDWCISVERSIKQPSIGTTTTAHGTFYLVTVRVSSQARGITQRATDAQVYLLDAGGQRYDPDSNGQQALDATRQSGPPLDTRLAPSGSFTHIVVFDLPKSASALSLVVTHGLFPEILIIGSEQSFLHKPTIFQLQS